MQGSSSFIGIHQVHSHSTFTPVVKLSQRANVLEIPAPRFSPCCITPPLSCSLVLTPPCTSQSTYPKGTPIPSVKKLLETNVSTISPYQLARFTDHESQSLRTPMIQTRKPSSRIPRTTDVKGHDPRGKKRVRTTNHTHHTPKSWRGDLQCSYVRRVITSPNRDHTIGMGNKTKHNCPPQSNSLKYIFNIQERSR